MGFPSNYGTRERSDPLNGSIARTKKDGTPTKTVFPNEMVAHVWAQCSQDIGRSGNGNFYFTGRNLFSYESHFCVGSIFDDKQGRRFVLLNADSYSISTSGHQSDARNAIRHLESFDIPALSEGDRIYSYAADCMSLPKQAGTFARGRIRSHVLANFERYSEESARVMLERVAEYPASEFAKVARECARANATKAKQDLKSKIESAAKLADMLDSEFRETLESILASSWDQGSLISNLTKRRVALHHAKKTARDHLSAKRQALLKRKHKLADSYVKRAESGYAKIKANKAAREAISELRLGFNLDSRLDNSKRLTALSSYCSTLAATKAPSSIRAKFKSAASDLIEAAKLVRAFETEQERIAQAEKRAAWLKGDLSTHNAGRLVCERGGAMLRAVDVERNDSGAISGGELETSWGARVPLTHALRAFRFLKLIRERGAPWEANGAKVRVGHFEIQKIDSDGSFTARCHEIYWGEVSRVALALGVFDIESDESAVSHSNA